MLSFAFSTRYLSLSRARLFPRTVSSGLGLFSRRYAPPSPSVLSAEARANVSRYICGIEEMGSVVPWNKLVTTYGISEADLKQIVAEYTAEEQKLEELSEKITAAAVNPDLFFDEQKGRCNWEALAAEFGLPLIDCLRAFNPAKSPHALRSMPEPFRWSQEDRNALTSLIRDTFDDPATLDWSLVDLYMNTTPGSCKLAVKFFRKPRMSPTLFEDIRKRREEGLKWKEIHFLYPYFVAQNSLKNSYGNYKFAAANTNSSAVWTKTEAQHLYDLISKHIRIISDDKERAIRLILPEFPNIPENEVRRRFLIALRSLRNAPFNIANCTCLRQLVSEHGEDWERIDKELETFPGAAQYNWGMIKDLKLTETWSLEDTKRLYHSINTGMGIFDSIRYIGSKTLIQFTNLKARLKKLALAQAPRSVGHTRLQWTDERKARLFELVALSADDSHTTWDDISKQLDCAVPECVYAYHMLQTTDWRPSTASHESKVEMVTRVCKDEYLSAGSIDWAKVSKLTGLDQRECLEACELDEGKERWIYDPETFRWDDANRMTDLIQATYPGPSPVNYRAVSNYLWIKLEDCLTMHNLLQGKIQWTDDVADRVTQMRAQGHKFAYIAKQLSPNLSESWVSTTYSRHICERTPLSDEQKQRIKALVDKYVGRVPANEVLQNVKRELVSWEKVDYAFVHNYFQRHPFYKKRLAGMDLADVTSRILSGSTAIKQAAAELGVTTSVLGYEIRKIKKREYPSRWTNTETDQLIAYVRSLDGQKADWVYFAKILGTKHYLQCESRYHNLKSKAPNIFI